MAGRRVVLTVSLISETEWKHCRHQRSRHQSVMWIQVRASQKDTRAVPGVTPTDIFSRHYVAHPRSQTHRCSWQLDSLCKLGATDKSQIINLNNHSND